MTACWQDPLQRKTITITGLTRHFPVGRSRRSKAPGRAQIWNFIWMKRLRRTIWKMCFTASICLPWTATRKRILSTIRCRCIYMIKIRSMTWSICSTRMYCLRISRICWRWISAGTTMGCLIISGSIKPFLKKRRESITNSRKRLHRCRSRLSGRHG